jgi:hypothetical protein
MIKFRLFSLIMALFLLGCNKQSTKEINTSQNEDSQTYNFDESVEIFNKIPLKQFPIIDSTNFNNFDFEIKSEDNILLKKIANQLNVHFAENYKFSYRLLFSDEFYSVVINYEVGEHELFTALLNLNSSFEIIDRVDIAYDEIAESYFQTKSKIEKHKIEIEQTSWMDEEQIIEISNYAISPEGKFIKGE